QSAGAQYSAVGSNKPGMGSQSREASFAFSVFNLMNAIMGSGILGLAYAMANTGIVGFCLLLMLVSSLAAYSVHLLLKLCDQTGDPFYYYSMSSYLFILKSELPAAINNFLNANGAGTTWYEDGRLLLILITLCFVLPLAILPRVGKQFVTNTQKSCVLRLHGSLLFVLVFVCLMIIIHFNKVCCLSKLQGFWSAYAIPTMAFSFLCHTAVLPIYCELDRPTKKRMQRVTNLSISLSFILYLVSALFGYLTFYAHVDSELLQGYDAYLPRDIVVMTVRIAILLSVLLTVPLIHFPARKAVILLLFGSRRFSWWIHSLTTVCILAVVLILAIFVPDIRNVFGVVGSTTSSCLLFVFPGLFYLRISNQRFRSLDYIGAAFLVVFGVMVGVLSLTLIIWTWVQSF
uniref:Amino acid transporter transmembrane domain-containing protein n=1 Tax=Periophthalmus magnuspinnatus TaxID=409849 RepID=A0A3B3ZIZ4_9GOBI